MRYGRNMWEIAQEGVSKDLNGKYTYSSLHLGAGKVLLLPAVDAGLALIYLISRPLSRVLKPTT